MGPDWAGEWDLDALRVDVVAEFRRKAITVPSSALVIVDGEMPRLDPWRVTVGVIGIALLAWFAARLRRTLGFLGDRAALADYLGDRVRDG